MEKMIKIPIELIEKLYRIQEESISIIETIEEILDEEALRRIKKGLQEINKGEIIEAEIDEVDKILL